jgi:glycosyltransferase involved in cell wall biosynthesis
MSLVRECVKSYVREATRPDKLNIVVIGATHERYEQALALTGHDFYCINHGKTWDNDYGQRPENYLLIEEIPHHLMIDLVLVHTSCDRLETAFNISKYFNVPIIRHTHILPSVQDNVEAFKSIPVHLNTFISDYSRRQWGYNANNSMVVEHGLDTDFWCAGGNIKRDNYLLSVVNLWAQRDWACGWNLWKQTVDSHNAPLPYKVVGKNPGLSEPASSIEELRLEYQSAKIFLNTSLHSPVPMSLLEAMACGCAVVSTNTCMIPEVIQHGYNGLLANTPEELKQRCIDLLYDNDLAKTLGDNARKTIQEKYSLKRFLQNWNNIFQEVLK